MYRLVSGNDQVIKALQIFSEYKEQIKSHQDFDVFSELVAKTSVNYDFDTVKRSCFNYCVEQNGKYAIYNTLTNSLYRFENTAEYELYASNSVASAEQKKVFVDAGFWLDARIPERELYIKFIETCHKFWRSNVSVVLTTTLKCNARCSYCYETGVKHKDFSLANVENFIAFLKKQDLSKGLQIIWFGGEPLLNSALIDCLAKRLEEESIQFVSYLITNGSLLSQDIISNNFKTWHVHDIQVTLDGTEENYEKIKHYVDSPTGHFYPILQKLIYAAKAGININIRLNISDNNKFDLYNLLMVIEGCFSKYDNVTFYPAFLTGIKDVVQEENRVEVIKKMLKILRNPKKMTFSSKFYSLPRITPCHRYSDRAFAIDADGNIFTCEHLVGRRENSIGNIATGLFKEDERCNPPPLRQECRECVFLPKCCGGCDSNYVSGDIPCMIEKYMISAYLEFLLE